MRIDTIFSRQRLFGTGDTKLVGLVRVILAVVLRRYPLDSGRLYIVVPTYRPFSDLRYLAKRNLGAPCFSAKWIASS